MSLNTSNQFQVVSMQKFTLLFFSTLGLYCLYWLYRNWMTYEQETGRKVFRLGRTLFAVFFIHQLFAHIDQNNRKTDSPFRWSPDAKAWIFIGAGILELIMAYIANWNQWQGPFFSLVSLLITRLVYFYSLYTAQLVINRSAGDPYGSSNQKLSSGNQVAIIAGLYLWFNLLYGVYLEFTGQLPEPSVQLPEASEASKS